ncbi:MAG: ImuA family protein [Caulobacteraceae bacterium]
MLLSANSPIVPGLRSQDLSALPALEPFEEAAAAHPQDLASALAFALSRAIEAAQGRGDDRPVAMVSTPLFEHERGRLFGWGAWGLGLDPARLLLIRARREPEALWAFEEALKSGAAAAVIGALERPAFVATRRLDFAARAGQASCLVLRAGAAGDLSAARLRWRVCAEPSAPHPFDPRAPGAARLTAELTRSRDGKSGRFLLEQDHETGRFRLAAGLADHGLAPQPHALRVA